MLTSLNLCYAYAPCTHMRFRRRLTEEDMLVLY